ncbi:MAG: 3-dehydroquinate synthase [Hyphomicrobiaceae bacterium]
MTTGDMDTVRVDLGARSYDVLIGSDLLRVAGRHVAGRLGSARAFVVTDGNVGRAHLSTISDALSRGEGGLRGVMTVEAGEASKRFEILEQVCGAMLDAGVERGDCLVALGGGVIGDLAGCAAAIVRRGIRYVQVPTSLLAQVDSSVGGKTAINTRHGKNLIGVFHQPSLVLADIDVLGTLPDRELRAGYAEVVKYGLLGDRSFYDWLDQNVDEVMSRSPAALRFAIRRSVEMKADIVARDETEQGDRALLNLGHTFGHALEGWTGYSATLLHGEGVAVGMCMAFRLSEHLGLCPPQTAARVAGHVKRAGLPTSIGDIPAQTKADPDRLLELMRQDKKVKDGQMTFILARNIGEAFVTRSITPEQVRSFLVGEIAIDNGPAGM